MFKAKLVSTVSRSVVLACGIFTGQAAVADVLSPIGTTGEFVGYKSKGECSLSAKTSSDFVRAIGFYQTVSRYKLRRSPLHLLVFPHVEEETQADLHRVFVSFSEAGSRTVSVKLRRQRNRAGEVSYFAILGTGHNSLDSLPNAGSVSIIVNGEREVASIGFDSAKAKSILGNCTPAKSVAF